MKEFLIALGIDVVVAIFIFVVLGKEDRQDINARRLAFDNCVRITQTGSSELHKLEAMEFCTTSHKGVLSLGELIEQQTKVLREQAK